jgi:hypothetical protein
MGFWMGEVWFLTLVKVARALDGVLAGMGEAGFPRGALPTHSTVGTPSIFFMTRRRENQRGSLRA